MTSQQDLGATLSPFLAKWPTTWLSMGQPLVERQLPVLAPDRPSKKECQYPKS